MLASKALAKGWLLACVLVLVSLVSAAAVAAPSAAEAARRREAKQHLATGKKLLRENFATDAVAELQRSIELYPTWEAEEELASAHRVLGQTLAARTVYDSLLATYGSTLRSKDYERISQQRALVDRDVTRLTIETEPSARVTVDGREAGTTPLPSPIELDPGRHEIVVAKPGYVDDRQRVELSPGPNTVRAALKLAGGKVTVETNPKARGKVTVDGRELGEVPGTFELPPGKHGVVVNAAGAVSAVQEVDVRAGEAVTLIVPLKVLPGTLRVQTPESDYRIFIDDRMRGQGTRDFALPAGAHHLRIEKVGFTPYRREVTVSPGVIATVAVPRLEALAPAPSPRRPAELPNEAVDQEPRKDDYPGVYAGLAVLGTLGPSATHGLWNTCPGADCSRVLPLGGGLGFRLGYSFGWVGLEALGIGLIDASITQVEFDTRTTKAESSFYGLPRDETFTFLRYGGGGGLGLRFTPPVPGVRPTLGVSGAFLFRAVRYLGAATAPGSTAQGIVPDAKDHDSNVETFAVPALIVDGGIFLGGTPGFKVHLGVLFMVEFDPRRRADPFDGSLGAEVVPPAGQRQSVPHGAPEMDLVSGTQLFVGPVLGMQFGH